MKPYMLAALRRRANAHAARKNVLHRAFRFANSTLDDTPFSPDYEHERWSAVRDAYLIVQNEKARAVERSDRANRRLSDAHKSILANHRLRASLARTRTGARANRVNDSDDKA